VRAIARALEVAAERAKRRRLGRVRIFTDAITRMAHDEPGPGQTHALQARKAIAALREREAAIVIEIRWRPAHKGIPGNEIADGWAKQAVSEPDDHGVEWLQHADKYGRRSMPPTCLAHLRRRASEKKWPEARSWCKRRHLNKGYVLRTKGKGRVPDNRPDDYCWWCDPENNFGTQQTRDHLFKHCYKWKDQQAVLWARVKEATKRAKRKWRVGDLLAD